MLKEQNGSYAEISWFNAGSVRLSPDGNRLLTYLTYSPSFNELKVYEWVNASYQPLWTSPKMTDYFLLGFVGDGNEFAVMHPNRDRIMVYQRVGNIYGLQFSCPFDYQLWTWPPVFALSSSILTIMVSHYTDQWRKAVGVFDLTNRGFSPVQFLLVDDNSQSY